MTKCYECKYLAINRPDYSYQRCLGNYCFLLKMNVDKFGNSLFYKCGVESLNRSKLDAHG